MRYHKFASLSLVLLIVGSGVGIAAPLSTAPQAQTQAADGVTSPTDDGVAPFQQAGPVNVSDLNVSGLEAVQLVQNETEGKAVGVRLVSQNGTPAFNVTVLQENRSVSQLTVDATEGEITAVRRNITVVETQFLGGEAFDFADLRTAADVIQLVQNETNGTVVNVGLRRGELVYGVALRTPEGARTQALVTATADPIVGLQTTNATQPANASA